MSKINSNNRLQKKLPAEQRKELLLKVATQVFLEKGYEATSLDDIISQAGGSKRSIYTEFGGKEELFHTIVTHLTTQVLAPMRQAISQSTDLRKGLYTFANDILSSLFTPTVLDLSRLALTDGVRFPKFAKIYFSSGPGCAADSLKELLDAAQKRGEIKCKDTLLSANQFIGMLRDNLYLQVLLKLRPSPKEQEIKILAQNAVDIFLLGVGYIES
ncbi:TetR/AcrR family transcriptional regulator [Orbaceae bacterium ac157xtp]